MSRLLICSVGTSLLTNPDRPWGGWKRGQPLPDPDAVDRWLAGADPVVASAELNTLRALEPQGSDEVRLLHSDTDEGKFCAERLMGFISARYGSRAEPRQLDALHYEQGSFAQRGLKSLVAQAIAAVREARGRSLQPVFCATGGFKAEIAFLNLLGALLGIEVYYIHEQFREVVRLPRLPLAWNAEFVQANRPFFEWIDAEPRPSVGVEQWLRGQPELRPLVEDAGDGNSYLNAAGDLLFKAARETLVPGPSAEWPSAAMKLPEEKNGLSGVSHHRPPGWEQFVARLCAIDCVERVRYDGAGRHGPRVQVLGPERGEIGVRYGEGRDALPLIVATTAREEAQAELVAEYIRYRLK